MAPYESNQLVVGPNPDLYPIYFPGSGPGSRFPWIPGFSIFSGFSPILRLLNPNLTSFTFYDELKHKTSNFALVKTKLTKRYSIEKLDISKKYCI